MVSISPALVSPRVWSYDGPVPKWPDGVPKFWRVQSKSSIESWIHPHKSSSKSHDNDDFVPLATPIHHQTRTTDQKRQNQRRFPLTFVICLFFLRKSHVVIRTISMIKTLHHCYNNNNYTEYFPSAFSYWWIVVI